MIQNKENRYFHVTLKKNMISILSRGLIVRIGKRSKECGETRKAIYLFPNIEEMETALGNWLGECFEEDDELIIIQVDLPKNFPIQREKDSNGDDFYEAQCYCNIEPKYITAIYTEGYKEIKQKESKGVKMEIGTRVYCNIKGSLYNGLVGTITSKVGTDFGVTVDGRNVELGFKANELSLIDTKYTWKYGENSTQVYYDVKVGNDYLLVFRNKAENYWLCMINNRMIENRTKNQYYRKKQGVNTTHCMLTGAPMYLMKKVESCYKSGKREITA